MFQCYRTDNEYITNIQLLLAANKCSLDLRVSAVDDLFCLYYRCRIEFEKQQQYFKIQLTGNARLKMVQRTFDLGFGNIGNVCIDLCGFNGIMA